MKHHSKLHRILYSFRFFKSLCNKRKKTPVLHLDIHCDVKELKILPLPYDYGVISFLN